MMDLVDALLDMLPLDIASQLEGIPKAGTVDVTPADAPATATPSAHYPDYTMDERRAKLAP